mgnify:CR=1 FL=1
MSVVKVYRKGIVVLPKEIREKAGIREGMLLLAEAVEGKVILRPLDLWERVWGCGRGLGSAEEVERELDEEAAREAELEG